MNNFHYLLRNQSKVTSRLKFFEWPSLNLNLKRPLISLASPPPRPSSSLPDVAYRLLISSSVLFFFELV